MLWAHAYHRFYFHVLLPAGFEQQSFTHQISPGAPRNRATHFPLASRTGIICGSYSLPLSLPSAPRLGSMELWTAPWIIVGWFHRLFCLKRKHHAVSLHGDCLSPAQAGLSLRVLPGHHPVVWKCFPSLWSTQTYWTRHCRWDNLMDFVVRAQFMRGWKKAFSSPTSFQDPSATIADCCQGWFCCNINDLSGHLEFHKHIFLIIQIKIAKV